MSENTAPAAPEHLYLPSSPPATNHGHTTASWTLVILVLVGSLVAAAGVIVAEAVLFWAGMGIAVLGVVVGKVLQVLGLGQPTQTSGTTA